MRSSDAEARRKVGRGQNRSKTVTALLGTFALLAPMATACMWDRDTLSQEIAAGQNNEFILGAITGRFDRFPPRYYEMRLDRVQKEFDSSNGVEALELCDDAGVACDRLGRSEEAIDWMLTKAELLEQAVSSRADLETHRYRYHANLGTFFIHRWIRSEELERNEFDRQRAHEHIAAALQINPDAHFGRERVQLLAIEWLMAEGDESGEKVVQFEDFLCHAIYAAEDDGDVRGERLSYASAALGIAGMIRLGAAWESPDMFHALGNMLGYERVNTVAYLAELRLRELGKAGKKGLKGLEPTTASVKSSLEDDRVRAMGRYWKKARAEAESWRKERLAYIGKALASGEHPDTDPSFWDGFEATTKPPAYSVSNPLPLSRYWKFVGPLCILVAAGLAVVIILRWLLPRSPAKA